MIEILIENLGNIATGLLIIFIVHQGYWRAKHLLFHNDEEGRVNIYHKKVLGWFPLILIISAFLLFYLDK